MRCDECKYWENPDGWVPVGSWMRLCNRTPHAEVMCEWDGAGKRTIRPQYADRTAAALDGSRYWAGLLPAPEHFCAMFNSRDA